MLSVWLRVVMYSHVPFAFVLYLCRYCKFYENKKKHQFCNISQKLRYSSVSNVSNFRNNICFPLFPGDIKIGYIRTAVFKGFIIHSTVLNHWCPALE